MDLKFEIIKVESNLAWTFILKLIFWCKTNLTKYQPMPNLPKLNITQFKIKHKQNLAGDQFVRFARLTIEGLFRKRKMNKT